MFHIHDLSYLNSCNSYQGMNIDTNVDQDMITFTGLPQDIDACQVKMYEIISSIQSDTVEGIQIIYLDFYIVNFLHCKNVQKKASEAN